MFFVRTMPLLISLWFDSNLIKVAGYEVLVLHFV